MRGWQVRQLGLGSSKFYDTAGQATGTGPLDRFGDVQLEGNIEYRFPIGTLFGFKLQSAVYMDAGNIWNRHVLVDANQNADEAMKAAISNSTGSTRRSPSMRVPACASTSTVSSSGLTMPTRSRTRNDGPIAKTGSMICNYSKDSSSWASVILSDS